MFMALLLDTSILIQGHSDPLDKVAISAVSIAELHFGVLVAPDDEARAHRLQRLATIEEAFLPLPFDADTARECGRLHAAVAQRGGKPRRRSFDLAIAATANVHGVPLLTLNAADFKLIEDLVDLRAP
jgi:predicted nucleic acid-binding protein